MKLAAPTRRNAADIRRGRGELEDGNANNDLCCNASRHVLMNDDLW